MKNPETVITLCMGSSCFSRGNKLSAEIVERYLGERGLTALVEVTGCLCDGHCKDGPNIRINGEPISCVEPAMIVDLLDHKLLAGPR